MKTYKTRDELCQLFNDSVKTGLGAEIGVFRGEFAESILKTWRGDSLFLIDTWRTLPADVYRDTSNFAQRGQVENMVEAVNRTWDESARTVMMRTSSRVAATALSGLHGLMDFVYIDANHARQSVLEDLDLWFPFVRKGGILSGHDYVEDGVYGGSVIGVKGAVDTWAAYHGHKVHVTTEDEFKSWWIVKL